MAGRPARVATHRGGLAGFEQPRYLHVEATDVVAPTRAELAELLRPQALLGRALLAVTLVASGPLLATDSTVIARFGWLVALGWLPVVGVLDLAERRWAFEHLSVAFLAWDVALFATVEIALHAPAAAALGYVLTVAFHAYLGGPRRAVVAVGLTSAAAVVVPWATEASVDGYRLVLQLLAGALVAWLLADAAQRHATSRAGILQVSERAAAILAGIADAVVVTSPTGRIQEWNPAASRLFEGPATLPPFARCADVLRLGSGLRQLRCDEGCALLAAERAGQHVEVVRVDSSGHRQPLLSSAAAVLDASGEPVEVIHSFRDITALKAADEAKTMFLATASHELKTPLTVIQGFAHVLQLEGLPDEQRGPALLALERRAHELGGIVDRLLMTSRIEAGRIELQVELVEIGHLLQERAEAVGAAHERTVEVEIAAPLPPVHAEVDAVTTVIDHLLDNAVKYSPDGGPIRLDVAEQPDEGVVVVSVTDAGVGMTADQADRCFDRFWQAETTQARRFGGTGIGLYIVRSLVEAMDGRIEVSSRPGEGSTFAVHLRTSARPDVADEDPGESASAPASQTSMIREYMRQVGVPLQSSGERP